MSRLHIATVVILASQSLIGGCAYTRMTSSLDPDFRAKKFSHICLFVTYADLSDRSQAEAAFVKAFGRTQTTCTPLTQLIPPTRQTDQAVLDRIFQDKGIDGLLRIVQTQYSEGHEYRTSGQQLVNGMFTSNTHTVALPRVRYEMKLHDTASRRVAWMATAQTRGNEFAGFSDLVRSLADETVSVLIRDGVTAPLAK